MVYSSIISKTRETKNIVSEGYLLSDLAYARIRFDLNSSKAYPSMLDIVREILAEPTMRPDLYILLEARPDTIHNRQKKKDDRERNVTEFFRTRYYSALAEVHSELKEDSIEKVYTDEDMRVTLDAIISVLRKRKVISG
jgi:thymidylate kinase